MVLQALDWLVVAADFAVILGLAWWVMRQRKDISASPWEFSPAASSSACCCRNSTFSPR
jgi:hypothetical protein